MDGRRDGRTHEWRQLSSEEQTRVLDYCNVSGRMGCVSRGCCAEEGRIVLVVCRPAAAQLRGRRRKKGGGPSWDLESRPALRNKGDEGRTCEKTKAWEVHCPSRFTGEMVYRACTQQAYNMRLRGGQGCKGWGEGLRPRKALQYKINAMNSISISLAHGALHTPMAAHQLPGAGPIGLWLELCSLTLLGASACFWGLLIHGAKSQVQWYPSWLCCQSQFHGPGWGQGLSVSCGGKGHPLPGGPAGPQSAPGHLSPLWFSQPGGGYRSHNGFSRERAEKGKKQSQKTTKCGKLFVS